MKASVSLFHTWVVVGITCDYACENPLEMVECWTNSRQPKARQGSRLHIAKATNTKCKAFFFFRMTSILGGNLSIPTDKRPNLNWPKQKENGLAVVMSCPEVALSAAQLDPGDPV